MDHQNSALLRLPEVKRRTGLGHSYIYEQIQAGQFPAPVKIGIRAVAWRSDDINAWIASRQPATSSKHNGGR